MPSLVPCLLALASCLCLSGAEDLHAPPVTTAKAWAIAEAATGRIMASEKGDEPLKSASTTKMMCAWVVLEQAGATPEVLEEWMTVSKLADSTPGSTAGVKAGEKITVREALYGLLLPSGNDLGNVLAEHLNPRLPGPGPESPAKLAEAAYATRRNFIAAMNRAAQKLGMTRTRYHLPYGDGGTMDDRTTTAHDLALLARAAMEQPLFREIVKTTSYKAKIRTPAGTERAITWENTNELLKLGPYDGVKTGLTPTAGHCLVASGELDGTRLIVVVLGAAANASRYADARNLFRWAWAKEAASGLR